jgi:hypothetical protein
VGRFATWCGKVNVHTEPGGTWVTDPGCSNGCGVLGAGYCQLFYPTTTHAFEVPLSSACKPFNNAGCTDVFMEVGQHEYVCMECIAY